MIRELLKDLGRYLPSYILPALVSILALPIITRLFPPADYGNYVLVLGTVSILSAITTAWLGASIVRFFPAYKLDNRLREFHGTIIKLALISIVVVSLIFSAVLFFARSHISANLYSLMRIGLPVFIASSGLAIFLDFLRAKRQASWYSFLTIWRSIAGLGLGMALVMTFKYGVDGLLWGSFLSTIVALPLAWKVAVGKLSLKEGQVCSPMTSEMAKYGFPIMIVNLATWILSVSDRYLLGLFRGSQEVGIYSASYAISERSILMIVSLFQLAAGPIVFKIWENQGKEITRQFLSRLARYYLIIGLPAAVGLSLLSRPVTNLLIAPAYYQGYTIIPIVVSGAFFIGIQHPFSWVLTCQKRTDVLMYGLLGSALLNISLNFLLIPRYGYMAAAFTTSISYACLLLLTVFFSRRFLVWSFPFKSLGKIACACTMMGVVVYPIGNNLTLSSLTRLVLAICVGVVVYFVTLFLLGGVQKEEVQEVRTFIRNLQRGIKR